MKFLATALLLTMALGWSSGHGLDLSDDTVDVATLEAEDFLRNLLNTDDDDDDDDDDDEIVDMDDALQKYRMLKSIARIVAEAEAADLINVKKRFFSPVLEKFLNDAAKSKAAFKDKWNKAKDSLKKYTGVDDLQGVINKLIPLLQTDGSVSDCIAKLEASKILGPSASVASNVAKPLCEVALAEKP